MKRVIILAIAAITLTCNDVAAQNSQHQIDQQEGETAVCTHLIGEAPDVAQTDSRANGRHDEAKCASETFSFLHFILSFSSQDHRFFYSHETHQNIDTELKTNLPV